MPSQHSPAPARPASRTLDSQNPWPGPEAFRESDTAFFFGRERAQSYLARLIVQNRLVVLYGRSGLGKTSLLRAGVFPLLREAHCLPIWVRLTFAKPGASVGLPDLRAQVSDAIESVVAEWKVDAPSLDPQATLWEWFYRSHAAFFNDRSRRVRPVLVLDQFEEAFTHGRASEAQAEVTDHFVGELIDLVRGSVPGSVAERLEQDASGALAFNTAGDRCGVLVALRQEFLAELLRLRPRLPSVLDYRFELAGMTMAEAERVVTGPGGHLIGEGVAGQIVKFVAGARRGTEDSAPEATMVDPAILSIFCSELNETRKRTGVPLITADLVTGAQDTIIADFYEGRVNDLDSSIERFIETRLVTESGYRNSEAVDEALRWPNMTPAIVEQLVDRRLLVREGSGPRARLELTHDVLLDPIIRKRTLRALRDREERARLAEEQARQQARDAEEHSRRERELVTAQALLEKERENSRLTADLAQQRESEANAERRARKRQRGLAVALAFALAGAIGLAVWAWLAGTAAKSSLAATHLEQGLAAITAGNRDRGLAYIARALRGDPTNPAARSLAFDALIHDNWPVPVGQVRHDGAVSGIQFDASGARLVTASEDGTARVWNATDWTPIGAPLQHKAAVYQAQFVASAKEVITLAADGEARLWDLASSRETRRFSHPSSVNCVAVSPVDDRVATGGLDGTIRIWTGNEPRTIQAHRAAVSVAAFDRAGRRLVTSALDGTTVVWDTNTGARLGTLAPHENEVVSVQFSPDGQLIATAARDAKIRLSSATTYKVVSESQHSRAIDMASFGPASQTIAMVSGNIATLWNARMAWAVGAEMVHDAQIVRVSYSPEGQRLLTASRDGTARLWDGAGAAISEPMRAEAPVTAAAFAPDGQHVVVGAQDGSITAWDVRNGSAISSVWRAECQDAWPVGFTANDREVVGACPMEGTLVFWNHDGKVVRRVPNPEWIGLSSLHLSGDARSVLVVAQTSAFIVRLQTGEVTELRHGSPVSSAAWSQDGRRVLTMAENEAVRIWDSETGAEIAQIAQPGQLGIAAFNSDGTIVVTAPPSGGARVWRTRGSEPRDTPLQFGSDSSSVRGVQITRDGRRVVTQTGAERAIHVRIHDAASGAVASSIPPAGQPVVFAEFAPTDLILTSRENQQLWDAGSGQLLTTLGEAVEAPIVARFSADGVRVAVAYADNRLKFWDVRTGQPHTHARWLPADYAAGLALSPDGQHAVTTTLDRRIGIWDVPFGVDEDAELMATMLEAIVGYRVNSRGAIEPVADRLENLRRVRSQCHAGAPVSRGVCEWALGDRHARTINPFTSVTVNDYVLDRLKSPYESDRVEARALLPWEPRLRPSRVSGLEQGAVVR